MYEKTIRATVHKNNQDVDKGHDLEIFDINSIGIHSVASFEIKSDILEYNGEYLAVNNLIITDNKGGRMEIRLYSE